MPPVGAVAGRGVLAQRDVGVVLDGDLVVVVEHDEVAELLGACQRRRFRRHSFLHVTVGGEHVDVVVERAAARGGVGIEQAALITRGHRHSDRRGQALTQRARGDFHAGGVAKLRVPRGLRTPGAQSFDVGELQPESPEVKLDVQRQAAVPARQHETVAAEPMRIAWVVAHHPLKQRVRQGSQAHRRAGMTVADLLHGVGGQYPDGVDSARVDIGPVLGILRRCQGGDVVEFGHGRAPYIVVWNRCPVAAGEVSTVGRARRMPAVTSRARRTTAPQFEPRKRSDEQRYWVERTATTQARRAGRR
jgi:hypothetical protein